MSVSVDLNLQALSLASVISLQACRDNSLFRLSDTRPGSRHWGECPLWICLLVWAPRSGIGPSPSLP